MKIGLLTFLHSVNIGCCLQAYALRQAIEERYDGVESEFIDYVKDEKRAAVKWFFRKIYSKIFGLDDDPSWTVKEFADIVRDRMTLNKVLDEGISRDKYERFWNYFKYSPRKYYGHIKGVDDYDLIIVGSDQVWNCGRLYLDTTYLLDFVKDSQKKCSYGSSLAMERIPPKYYKSYKKYLSDFKYLSCREKRGCELISELTSREVENVMDPVYLLKAEDWMRVEEPGSGVRAGKYILVFTYFCSQRVYETAKILKEVTGFDIAVISVNRKDTINVGPGEWIWYIRNSAAVVTDSFHAMSFSIIFNKMFYADVPDFIMTKSTNSRVKDLLSLLSLNDRLLEGRDEKYREVISENWDKIDYPEVNKRIDKEIKSSFAYLDKIIGKDGRG